MGSVSAIYFYIWKRSFVTIVERSGTPDLPRDTSAAIYRDMWEWRLNDLSGKQFVLSQFKGRVVVVHLWATWCTPCVRELPEIQVLYDSLRNRDVAFLVVSREKETVVKEFLKGSSYTFPVYTSAETEPDAFQPDDYYNAIPSTIILDRTGVIRMKQIGGAIWSDRKTMRFFRSLL
jgi:thiol-disulfide isomerase/thioredoxin